MFGLGFTELLVLLLVAFLVFGPKQFPLVAKSFIKLVNELKMTFSAVKTEFDSTEAEVQKHIHQITSDVKKSLDMNEEGQATSKEKIEKND